jgi:hypothetical protein
MTPSAKPILAKWRIVAVICVTLGACLSAFAVYLISFLSQFTLGSALFASIFLTLCMGAVCSLASRFRREAEDAARMFDLEP